MGPHLPPPPGSEPHGLHADRGPSPCTWQSPREDVHVAPPHLQSSLRFPLAPGPGLLAVLLLGLLVDHQVALLVAASLGAALLLASWLPPGLGVFGGALLLGGLRGRQQREEGRMGNRADGSLHLRTPQPQAGGALAAPPPPSPKVDSAGPSFSCDLEGSLKAQEESLGRRDAHTHAMPHPERPTWYPEALTVGLFSISQRPSLKPFRLLAFPNFALHSS